MRSTPGFAFRRARTCCSSGVYLTEAPPGDAAVDLPLAANFARREGATSLALPLPLLRLVSIDGESSCSSSSSSRSSVFVDDMPAAAP